jgi:hypothetical protein
LVGSRVTVTVGVISRAHNGFREAGVDCMILERWGRTLVEQGPSDDGS